MTCSGTPRSVLAAVPPLRVLFDGRKLGPHGIGVHAEQIIAGLLEVGGVQLSVLGRAEEIRRYPWGGEVEILDDRSEPYSIPALWRMSDRVRAGRFDLFHTPHYMLPFGLGLPGVVAIHDLIQVHAPERWWHGPVAGALIRSALSRAARVVTVSEAVRQELLALGHDHLLAAKVVVIPNALPGGGLQQTRLGGPREGLLAVISTPKPHKGVAELLEALSMLRQTGLTPRLILAGAGTEDPAIRALVAAAAPGTQVEIRGRVGEEELRALYRRAQALVVASRAEGFCIPVIEAQAADTPVVTTPIPAVREIVLPGDVVCADFSPGAIAAGIRGILAGEVVVTPPEVRRSHLARFDRLAIARQVSGMYRDVVPVAAQLKAR